MLLITSQCPGQPLTEGSGPSDLAPVLGEKLGVTVMVLNPTLRRGRGGGPGALNVVGTFLCVDVLLGEGSVLCIGTFCEPHWVLYFH